MFEDVVDQLQQGLLAGSHSLDRGLGLESPAPHVERAEREVLDRILPEVAALVGPAARLIDCGPFTGLRTGLVLEALERPKAAVLMNREIDPRLFDTLGTKETTAEISVAPQGATASLWDLPAIGTGLSLALLCGGGLGFLSEVSRADLFKGAEDTLKSGDFLLLTTELVQNAAIMEAAYQDFGLHLVRTCLTRLGKSQGLEPRIFHKPQGQRVLFGAIAQSDASIIWQDGARHFQPGDWLEMGASRQFGPEVLAEELDAFSLKQAWRSQDGWVELLLFEKK